MNKKILIGSILAVVILTLVSFSSVVGYSSVKSNPSNTIITDEYDNPTPIQLVFQLISKLRNHNNIQNVESEDDVIRIIEGDEELNSIVENLKSYDCGCEDEIPTDWNYPGFCTILYLLFWFFLTLVLMGISTEIPFLINDYANELNCYWAVEGP